MKTVLFAFLLLSVSAGSQVTDQMKLVDSTSSFSKITEPLSRGSLLKTGNFHFYEITDKVPQKLMSAQPKIMVYQDGKKLKMKIEGIEKLLSCNKIQEVIESNIDGDFKGWDGNTLFKLVNQEVWKQDNPTGTIFANLYRPAVTIYLTAEGYKMKIAGLNESAILVRKQ